MTENYVLDKVTKNQLRRSLAKDDANVSESAKVPDLDELKAITMYLKLTDSLVIELVPGSDNLLEQKEFTWSVIDFSAIGMNL